MRRPRIYLPHWVQWKSVLQPFKSACDTQEQKKSACVGWKNNGDMAFYFTHEKKKFRDKKYEMHGKVLV